MIVEKLVFNTKEEKAISYLEDWFPKDSDRAIEVSKVDGKVIVLAHADSSSELLNIGVWHATADGKEKQEQFHAKLFDAEVARQKGEQIYPMVNHALEQLTNYVIPAKFYDLLELGIRNMSYAVILEQSLENNKKRSMILNYWDEEQVMCISLLLNADLSFQIQRWDPGTPSPKIEEKRYSDLKEAMDRMDKIAKSYRLKQIVS
jgi:hypothetical protein